MIKRISLLLVFNALTAIAFTQYGVSVIYNNHLGAEDWDAAVEGGDHLKSNGWGVSVDYWFRLKNYRIEFSPEVGWLKGDYETRNIGGISQKVSWSQLFVLGNVNIYPFDIEGDCNCPTFGKEGNFFQKGFYLQIAPGWSVFKGKTETIDDSSDGSSGALLLSIGGGLDFGLFEYLTLTPYVKLVHGIEQKWSGSEQEISSGSTTRDVMAGLHLVYRLDYKKRRF